MRTSVDAPSKRQKVRFVKLTMDRQSCVVRPTEVKDMMEDGEDANMTMTDVWMSEAEYEALPEFQGW